MAFTEEITAFTDFLNQLLEGYCFPLTRTAGPHTLERLPDAVGCSLMLEHGGSPRTRSGAAFQAVISSQHGIDLTHGRFHGRMVRGGQWMIGVAGNADDAVRGCIDPHSHAALGPTPQTARWAHHLAGMCLQSPGDRVNTKLRLQRVAAYCVFSGRTRSARHQAFGASYQGLTVARRECGRAACYQSSTQQLAAQLVGSRFAFFTHDTLALCKLVP